MVSHQDCMSNDHIVKEINIMPLPLMATVKDTTCQGGEMERIYKDDGSSTGEQKFAGEQTGD